MPFSYEILGFMKVVVHDLTVFFVVSEFMFSLKAAIYFYVHLTIDTGASSAAEPV